MCVDLHIYVNYANEYLLSNLFSLECKHDLIIRHIDSVICSFIIDEIQLVMARIEISNIWDSGNEYFVGIFWEFFGETFLSGLAL